LNMSLATNACNTSPSAVETITRSGPLADLQNAEGRQPNSFDVSHLARVFATEGPVHGQPIAEQLPTCLLGGACDIGQELGARMNRVVRSSVVQLPQRLPAHEDKIETYGEVQEMISHVMWASAQLAVPPRAVTGKGDADLMSHGEVVAMIGPLAVAPKNASWQLQWTTTWNIRTSALARGHAESRPIANLPHLVQNHMDHTHHPSKALWRLPWSQDMQAGSVLAVAEIPCTTKDAEVVFSSSASIASKLGPPMGAPSQVARGLAADLAVQSRALHPASASWQLSWATASAAWQLVVFSTCASIVSKLGPRMGAPSQVAKGRVADLAVQSRARHPASAAWQLSWATAGAAWQLSSSQSFVNTFFQNMAGAADRAAEEERDALWRLPWARKSPSRVKEIEPFDGHTHLLQTEDLRHQRANWQLVWIHSLRM